MQLASVLITYSAITNHIAEPALKPSVSYVLCSNKIPTSPVHLRANVGDVGRLSTRVNAVQREVSDVAKAGKWDNTLLYIDRGIHVHTQEFIWILYWKKCFRWYRNGILLDQMRICQWVSCEDKIRHRSRHHRRSRDDLSSTFAFFTNTCLAGLYSNTAW